MTQGITNNLQALHREILEKFLIPLNPDMSVTCLLNILNSQLAHMVTFKRIRVQITPNEDPAICNYYGMNFISSGGGKDKVNREIDRYLLKNFKIYVISESKEYIKRKQQELQEEAREKFPESESKQAAYIEKNKHIRNIRYEIGDATTEGLYADCVTLQDYGFGSVFIKIPEFGAYIENPKPPQVLFLNMLLELYEGTASLKSIKGESIIAIVENIPTNCLLYSDTNKILNTKAGSALDSLLDCGLVRRSFITYMEDAPLTIIDDPQEEKAIIDAAYEYGKNLNEEIIKKFMAIPKENPVYLLNDEAYIRFHKYKNENKIKYGKILFTSEDVIKKELRGRFWKTLKLAGIIAALEHPENTVVTVQDMEYAIYMSELFAESLSGFFKISPKTYAEKLFSLFMDNKCQWLTKSDISKKKFIPQKNFKAWLEENIELTKEMAGQCGYKIIEESYGGATGHSGVRYKLVDNNIGKKLNENIKDTKEMIGV